MKNVIKTLAFVTIGVVIGRVSTSKTHMNRKVGKLTNGHFSSDQIDTLQEIIRYQDELYRNEIKRKY